MSNDHENSLSSDSRDETPVPLSPGGGGPARSRGRRRRRKLWAIVGAVSLGFAFAGAGVTWMLTNRYESQVQHSDLLGGNVSKEQQRQHFAAGPINLLLLGSDSRQGEPDQGMVSGQRSDTIMLVHIAASRDRAAVISIPRDSYVYVPAGGNWAGGMNKINAALAYGGAPLATKTITRLIGVTLDGAAIANFAGVRNMVDAVGGVKVCLAAGVTSGSGRAWAPGCHQMNGDQAEDFMRQRKSVPGGDFGRMKDQQLVVRALFEKATTQGLLANPVRLDRLLMTAARSLTIDESLNLRQLVLAAGSVKPPAVQFATVPHSNPGMRTWAGSSVELDAQKSQQMFAAIRNDTIDRWIVDNPTT